MAGQKMMSCRNWMIIISSKAAFLFLALLTFPLPSSSFVSYAPSRRMPTVLFRQISNYPLRDGRIVKVHNTDFSSELRLKVQRVARAAIRKKNSFSFCLSGGLVAGYLKGLPSNIPFHKWHIFLADEIIGISIEVNRVL
jgi:hypothetical protein